MVYHYNTIDNISIYVDPLMEDNKILKGRKQDSNDYYLVVNEKTANLINNIFLKKERKEKLNKISNVFLENE